MGGDDCEARELELAFMMEHTQLSQNFGNLFQAAATLSAIADLLVAKGVLAADEVEREIERARQRLAQSEFGRGLQIVMHPGEGDKHTASVAEVDCAARLPHCRSACCSLDVALGAQDLEEGKLRWNLSRPYLLRRGPDGCCVHRDAASGACGVYEARPAICRGYSCANDERIWIDFERMIPNCDSIAALLARTDRPRLRGRDAWEEAPAKVPTVTAMMPATSDEDAGDADR